MQDDYDVRTEALAHAVRIELGNTGTGDGTISVVKRAEAFLDFLTGPAAAEGPEAPVLVDHPFIPAARPRNVADLDVCTKMVTPVEGGSHLCGLLRDRHRS